MFLTFLAACLLAAAYVGVLAYREGMKVEVSKRAGEAWLQWMAESAASRGRDDFPHAACAARAGATWGTCESWLTGSDGPLNGQRNAYTDEPLKVVAACGTGDRSTAGMVALEKVTPLPPGAAVPFVVSALAAADPIDQKVTIRVVVCNKDVTPIRVGEVEF